MDRYRPQPANTERNYSERFRRRSGIYGQLEDSASADTDSNSDTHAHTNSDTHSHTHANTHAHTHAKTNPDTHTNPNAVPDSDAFSGGNIYHHL